MNERNMMWIVTGDLDRPKTISDAVKIFTERKQYLRKTIEDRSQKEQPCSYRIDEYRAIVTALLIFEQVKIRDNVHSIFSALYQARNGANGRPNARQTSFSWDYDD
jgi:hypothetical protein